MNPAGGELPDVPSIALAALGIDPGLRLLLSGRALRAMTDGKRRLYQALAASVSRGEYRALADARHSTITVDRPDVVMDAIRDVLGWISAYAGPSQTRNARHRRPAPDGAARRCRA